MGDVHNDSTTKQSPGVTQPATQRQLNYLLHVCTTAQASICTQSAPSATSTQQHVCVPAENAPKDAAAITARVKVAVLVNTSNNRPTCTSHFWCYQLLPIWGASAMAPGARGVLKHVHCMPAQTLSAQVCAHPSLGCRGLLEVQGEGAQAQASGRECIGRHPSGCSMHTREENLHSREAGVCIDF